MSCTRTLGVDLDGAAAARCFEDHVPASKLSPRELFRCKLQGAKGLTTDWGQVSRYHGILTELVDAGRGRIAKQASLHRQFVTYLQGEGCTWSYEARMT